MNLGVHFRVSDPVVLERDPGAPCGIQVHTDFEDIRPHFLFLCAGVGNAALLGQVGLPDPCGRFVRAPLMILEYGRLQPLPMHTGVYAEMFCKHAPEVAVAQHLRDRHGRRSEGGWLVVGGGRPHDDQTDSREVVSDHQKQLRLLVPDQVSAGIEPRFTAAVHSRKWWPHVEALTEFPRVMTGIPGRATMALYAAEAIMKKLPKRIESFTPGSAPSGTHRPKRQAHWKVPEFNEAVNS